MKTEKNVKPLREGTRKNNQEKPNSTIQKSYVIKPPRGNKEQMSNNKQSSVLFLWQELKHWLPERYTVDDSVKILSILNQSVEMHKEEILSFNKLLDKHEIDAWTNNTILLTAEEFYNETYGGEK